MKTLEKNLEKQKLYEIMKQNIEKKGLKNYFRNETLSKINFFLKETEPRIRKKFKILKLAANETKLKDILEILKEYIEIDEEKILNKLEEKMFDDEIGRTIYPEKKERIEQLLNFPKHEFENNLNINSKNNIIKLLKEKNIDKLYKILENISIELTYDFTEEFKKYKKLQDNLFSRNNSLKR